MPFAMTWLAISGWGSYQAQASREALEENRELVRANREIVKEMRETRIAQDRPHVLVEVDYTYSPALDIVIRNIGHGPAKNITFDPLPDLVTHRGVNLSDFAYFLAMDWTSCRQVAKSELSGIWRTNSYRF